jgi:type VI secretion system protein ImpF
MANLRDGEEVITPSILVRLIDLEPRFPTEPPKSHRVSLRDLKAAVKRDMEWLLNSRKNAVDIDDGLEEVQRSVFAYGLPDITGLSAKDPHQQVRMKSAIESAIEFFEPRFFGVKVTLEPVSVTDKQLKFRIEANLDVEPAPEPVVFDTVLEFGSGGFSLTEK